jgi:hypothetical protein
MEYKNIERLRRHELFDYVKEKGLEHKLHYLEEKGINSILNEDFGIRKKLSPKELEEVWKEIYHLTLSNNYSGRSALELVL